MKYAAATTIIVIIVISIIFILFILFDLNYSTKTWMSMRKLEKISWFLCLGTPTCNKLSIHQANKRGEGKICGKMKDSTLNSLIKTLLDVKKTPLLTEKTRLVCPVVPHQPVKRAVCLKGGRKTTKQEESPWLMLQ